MGLTRRRLLTAACGALAAPPFARAAPGDVPKFMLKLHHFQSAVSSAHGRFLAPWARKVEAESNGRIRIDIFPSMQLGGAPAQLYDQARDGVADIVWALPGQTPGRFPKIEVFELPFVASQRAFVNSKALESYAAENLRDEFREVHPICFWCQDHGLVHAHRPVRTLEDVRRLRLHFPTRLAGEALRALGARGVDVPMPQLRFAVMQRVIDGGVIPWEAMPPLKLQDVLKFHTEISGAPALTTSPFVLAMNKRAYDRLPGELKKVIDNNSGDAVAGLAGTLWDIEAADVADNARRRGGVFTTLTTEEAARWRKATGPVIEAWLKQMKDRRIDGGKLLASARTLLAKYEQEPEPAPPSRPEAAPATPPTAQAEGRRPPVAVEPPKAMAPTPAPPPKPAPPAAPARRPRPELLIPL